MNSSPRRRAPAGQPSLTLVEEATHLLKQLPLSAWLGYVVGTAPFVAYLFYFWSDMSRSSNAMNRVAESSLLLSLLYGWMKTWHAVFCGRMMAILEARENDEASAMSGKGWLKLVGGQVLIHATMPVVLLLSLLAMLPFAWVYAFYHNVSALAWGHFQKEGTARELMGLAVAQAHLAPLQNHLLISIIAAAGLLVYVNSFSALATVLILSKSITGTENAFSANPFLFMSSAFQMLLIGISYLVMNPLVKAVYALRCFYGVSRRTGADMTATVRRWSRSKAAGMGRVLMMALLVMPMVGMHAEQVTEPAEASRLEESIRQVLQGNEYQWRMPRDAGGLSESQDSWIGSVLKWITTEINEAFESIGKMIGDLFDWLFRRDPSFDRSEKGQGGSEWMWWMPRLLWGMVIALVIGLGWMMYRHWKQARQTVQVESEDGPVEVNLEAENVVASQLPEDEWRRLAREKATAGDLRLALRALFLATLAHLGEKRLLTIQASKSNGDYVRELGWRARGRGELHEGFQAQVRMFDQVWYGWHDVGEDLMAKFEEQHERITSHAS
jgi:hypothetical protein